MAGNPKDQKLPNGDSTEEINYYCRMGLARAVIYEALHRLAQKGAKKVYVAADKDLYYAIGFSRAYANNMWFKML